MSEPRWLAIFRRVYSLAFRMIPNAADTENLIQGVFFIVWLKRAEWQPGEATFSIWLRRVTINRCIIAIHELFSILSDTESGFSFGLLGNTILCTVVGRRP